ncbi:DNA-directed RNA polymerase III, subunit Rpc31 [Irpex rosettiformis]|uniref:DNA-directed RNA polymerase III, subunit Rpc31 n=1 Tax=Irpex rosettiformis TaxID=378272 RepID=A0ACB8U907_9APHY|nr:DNA-directed RNA polymerase III, subunit Rpc31 [Irpex rosettiformis]
MSRGGRGGGRGGRGGFGGRNGFGGLSGNVPPMGLTFADIQNLSREATELYPVLDPLPVLTEYNEEDKRIADLQIGFTTRLRQSSYYIVEHTKSTELPKYSDKYRPSTTSQPTLKRKDLHEPFFPKEVFEGYFNPRRKKTSVKHLVYLSYYLHPDFTAERHVSKKRLNIDELVEDAEELEKSDAEKSDAGSVAAESDYDVEEEYDNDYAENYFDNGEADDNDDLGGGGGGDGGGGGLDYD